MNHYHPIPVAFARVLKEYEPAPPPPTHPPIHPATHDLALLLPLDHSTLQKILTPLTENEVSDLLEHLYALKNPKKGLLARLFRL